MKEFIGGLLIVLAFTLFALGAGAAESVSVPTVGKVNSKPTLMALVRVDRAKRLWKFAKLVPGAIIRYEYVWVLEDGSQVNKLEDYRIPNVPDECPINQSHPNVWVGMETASILCGALPWLVAHL